MNERKRYPSDLTDERWALIEPVITVWKAAHHSVSGHAKNTENTGSELKRLASRGILAGTGPGLFT